MRGTRALQRRLWTASAAALALALVAGCGLATAGATDHPGARPARIARYTDPAGAPEAAGGSFVSNRPSA